MGFCTTTICPKRWLWTYSIRNYSTKTRLLLQFGCVPEVYFCSGKCHTEIWSGSFYCCCSQIQTNDGSDRSTGRFEMSRTSYLCSFWWAGSFLRTCGSSRDRTQTQTRPDMKTNKPRVSGSGPRSSLRFHTFINHFPVCLLLLWVWEWSEEERFYISPAE